MITVREFIKYWENSEFTNYNETDLREEFIRPLLYLLGYSKNKINDIITENTLKLSEPFQRVGRDRIRIDYIPTIRLKAFWILEAKSGNPKEMDVGDMLQAYLYATHPEIQAPYIVLCNGWSLQVFDVHNYSDWKKPVFTISSEDCSSKFDELREILGAETILNYQRQALLKRIRDTFEVEIDENQLDAFCRSFDKEKNELKVIIKNNASQLWRKEFEKAQIDEQKRMQALDNQTLVNIMDLYTNAHFAEDEYLNRIISAAPDERADLLQRLSQVYHGRAKATFKCRYLRILIQVYKKRLNISSKFLPKIEDCIKSVIDENLSYFEGNELENALCFLDRVCCRAAGVIVKNGAMDFGHRIVEFKKKYLPKEERFIHSISDAREIVPYIFCMADAIWYAFSNGSIDDIKKNTILMNNLIDCIVDTEGIKEYLDKDNDLFRFEEFGDKYDYLSGVTYVIIRNNITLMDQLRIDNKWIENATSQSISLFVPKLDKSWGDNITEQDKKSFQSRFVNALAFGTCLYAEALHSRSDPFTWK